MPVLKNSGPLLTSKWVGGESPIPPEFIAAMERGLLIQENPTDIEPTALGDTVVESSVVQERTDERKKTTITKKPGAISLQKINTDDSGQPVQLTQTLYLTGSIATPIPTATKNVAVRDLGNGYSISEVAVSGTYVGGVFTPGIFAHANYGAEVPDVIPEKFRAIVPLITSYQDELGTVDETPTLATGELQRSEEQINEFVKRVVIHYMDPASLPKTLIDYTTDDLGQTTQLKQTLYLTGSLTPALPTATRKVTIRDLGNGYSIYEYAVVGTYVDGVFTADIFTHESYTIEIPDLLPEEFRSIAPLITSYVNSIGTADSTPSLAAGELMHSEEQLNEFIKRVVKHSHDVTALPATLVDQQTGEDFGFGGTITVTRKVVFGTQVIQEGFLVLRSIVKNLGAGLTVRETSTVTEWPTLQEVQTDPVEGIVVNVTKDLVVAGTGYPGSGFVEINPLDKWRSIQLVSAVDPTTLPADLIYYTTHPFSFPDTLLSIKGIWDSSSSTGASVQDYVEKTDGTVVISTARAFTKAEAGVVGAIAVKVQSGYRGQCIARITRHYQVTPPATELLVPVKIIPVQGTAIISFVTTRGSQERGTGAAADSADFEYNQRSFQVGPFLTGSWTLDEPTATSPTPSISATAIDELDSKVATTAILGAGANLLRVEMPISTPTALTSNSFIVTEYNVERRPFGVYVVEKLELQVP